MGEVDKGRIMEYVLATLITTIISGIVILFLEYRTRWFAHFIYNRQNKVGSNQDAREWASASTKAAINFQNMQQSINWKDYSVQVISAENPKKGVQKLRIKIAKNYLSSTLPDRGMYDLSINRVGDILEIAPVQAQTRENYSHKDIYQPESHTLEGRRYNTANDRREINQERLNEAMLRLLTILISLFVFIMFSTSIFTFWASWGNVNLGSIRGLEWLNLIILSEKAVYWVLTVLSLAVYMGLYRLTHMINDTYILPIIDNYKEVTPGRRAICHLATMILLICTWMGILAFFLFPSTAWWTLLIGLVVGLFFFVPFIINLIGMNS